jgi:small subunit ribosomal protein S18
MERQDGETPSPESARPESARPESARPESGRPDGPRAEGARPEGASERPRYGDRSGPPREGSRFGDRGDGPREGSRFGDRDRDRGDGPRFGGGGRFGGRGRGGPRGRKICAFCVDHVIEIDYKDVSRLHRYLSDRGKIEPRRKTGTCARHQRRLGVALKNARHMALLPYTAAHRRGA